MTHTAAVVAGFAASTIALIFFPRVDGFDLAHDRNQGFGILPVTVAVTSDVVVGFFAVVPRRAGDDPFARPTWLSITTAVTMFLLAVG